MRRAAAIALLGMTAVLLLARGVTLLLTALTSAANVPAEATRACGGSEARDAALA